MPNPFSVNLYDNIQRLKLDVRQIAALHASRLDILLAPGAGRRYPNLSDHRSNVEYDVQRVLTLLKDEPFVAGRPRM